jgi:hypothetical protein
VKPPVFFEEFFKSFVCSLEPAKMPLIGQEVMPKELEGEKGT